MSTNTTSEGEIRKSIIEADLVDCIIAMPGQLFYTTPIPVCLWFVARNKKNDVGANVGANLSVRPCPYEDVPGFCKSAGTDEIKEHGYVLTPGRYVGAAVIEDDGVPFEEKMAGFSATLYEQFAEADQLEATIRKNLEVMGFGERRQA